MIYGMIVARIELRYEQIIQRAIPLCCGLMDVEVMLDMFKKRLDL
jgi:hypothetical protein